MNYYDAKFYMLEFFEMSVFSNNIEALIVTDESAMNELDISYSGKISHFLITAYTIADSFGVDPDNYIENAIVHVVLDMD